MSGRQVISELVLEPGTGKAIDWTIAAAIARQRPVILSGGLNAANAADAVAAVAPYAIDVSSGVERAFAILREEFAIALALLGTPTPADLTPSHLVPSVHDVPVRP